MKKIIALFARALPYLKSAGSWFITVEGGPLGWALGIFDTLWNSQVGRIAIIGGGCLVGGWVAGWNHERGAVEIAVKTAVEAQNNEWKSKLAAANSANEARVTAALAMGNRVPPVTASTDLLRLCKSDPSCRSALAKK